MHYNHCRELLLRNALYFSYINAPSKFPILTHYCTGVPVVQYHSVLENTSAIMDSFLFHTSVDGVLDPENWNLNVF